MSFTKSDVLKVPGASLYYKMRGSGPILLILQGGDGDAEGSESLAELLVDYYTVVTYDRRGLSRSEVEEPFKSPDIEIHSDDAHRLLAHLTNEAACVFGSSFGALLGLDLVARHPEQVRTLVAHEPPAPELLPAEERKLAMRSQEEVDETYRREGVVAAMRKNLANSGLNFADREPDVILPQPGPYRSTNLEFFHKYDAPAAHSYSLDIAALKKASTRIVLAGGRTSREFWAYHSAEVLADQLGTEFVEFPGGHNGHILHPRAFAEKLREVLVDEKGK